MAIEPTEPVVAAGSYAQEGGSSGPNCRFDGGSFLAAVLAAANADRQAGSLFHWAGALGGG